MWDLEAIAGHLLHQNARVALSKLAAGQEVLLIEPRARHKRVRAHLILQPVRYLYRLFHRLHLYR